MSDSILIKHLLNEMFELEMYQEYLDCVGIYLQLGGVL